MSRRVVVLGGRGFFGRAIVDLLRQDGAAPETPAHADLDVEDSDSIRARLRSGDVVIDAAGPFQHRTGTLVRAAMELGCDLIDISDSIDYAGRVCALQADIESSGIRVLSSCSSVSAVTASLVKWSGLQNPKRVSAFLVPATRHTANAGSARSLIESIGRDVRVWREGRLQSEPGWRRSKGFAMLGMRTGYVFESADSLWLPRIWPSLSEVECFVDTNTPGLNLLLNVASRSSLVRWGVQTMQSPGRWFARCFGSAVGGYGIEVDGVRVSILGGPQIAAAPAALAAQKISRDEFEPRGLVLPHLHADLSELLQRYETLGMKIAGLPESTRPSA